VAQVVDCLPSKREILSSNPRRRTVLNYTSYSMLREKYVEFFAWDFGLFCFCLFGFFETGSYHVAQAAFKFTIFLP
jgi:hypothetical protein